MTSEVRSREPLKLLVDPPAAGAWNMGGDEMLMERAAEGGKAVLRFYEWSPATLSLGYFQNAADRDGHETSRGAPMVRRSSGGGAIVHDRELTYSISLPTSHPLAADAETLYRNIHGTLLAALAEFGVAARLNETATTPFAGEPFLCFQRRAVGDVLLDRYKICGSAQRRRRGAILQHGSVLLAQSPAAPELPGIAELAASPSGGPITSSQLVDVWTRIWRATLSPLEPYGELSAEDKARANWHAAEKYGDDAWTNRR
jgi:lipoate-protein ligase A